MKNIKLFFGVLGLALMLSGCQTYFGYEAKQEKVDVAGSEKKLNSEFVQYKLLFMNDTSIRIQAEFKDSYEKKVVTQENREHIYIPSAMRIGRTILFPLVAFDFLGFAVSDWNLASHGPGFFRRLSYTPPFSCFLPFNVPPYWLKNPASLKEGKNVIYPKKRVWQESFTGHGKWVDTDEDDLFGTPSVEIKNIERESIELKRETVTYSKPSSKIILSEDSFRMLPKLQLTVAGKPFKIENTRPLFEYLPYKPLPPKDIPIRIQYGETDEKCTISSLSCIPADVEALWKKFQKQSHIPSLIELRKRKFVDSSDFDQLLTERLKQLPPADLITLSEQNMLASPILNAWLTLEPVDMDGMIQLKKTNIISPEKFSELLDKNILSCSTDNIAEVKQLNLLSEALFRKWLAEHQFTTIVEIEKLHAKRLISQKEKSEIANRIVDALFKLAIAAFYKIDQEKLSHAAWGYDQDIKADKSQPIAESKKYFTQLKEMGWIPGDFWLAVLDTGLSDYYNGKLSLPTHYKYLTEFQDRTSADQYTLAYIIYLWGNQSVPQYHAGLLYLQLAKSGWKIPEKNYTAPKLIALYYLSQRDYKKAAAGLEEQWITRQIQEWPYISNSVQARDLLQAIKSSFVRGYDIKTLGQAVSDYFSDVHWAVKEFPSGKKIVEVSGYDKQSNLLIIRLQIIKSPLNESKISYAVEEIAQVNTIDKPILLQGNRIDFLFGKSNTTTNSWENLLGL